MVNDATPQPFDIAKDCALRVRLMRLSEQEHILVLVDHNIRPEGWPSNVFWSDDE